MKKNLTIGLALAMVLTMTVTMLGSAAELLAAELTGTSNDVTVTQGSSAPFTISVTAGGAVSCTQTAGNPSTATVDTVFSISAGGTVSSNTPSGMLAFWAGEVPCSGNNGAVTWTGAPAAYTVSATVSAAAGTPVGTYNLVLSSAAGTTAEANPNSTGAKLEDTSATTIKVHVVAPPPPSDATPPAISKVITGTTGANGWYTSDVQVAWTVTDPDSAVSIDSGCGTQNFTSETTGVTSSCTAHSAGGSSSDSVTIKIDKTGPSAALSITGGTLGSNGWYTSDVTVHTSGSDAVSDNVTCTADQTLTSDSTGTVFNGSCTNGAGLSTDAAPLTVKLDKTGPSVTLAISAGTAGANGWYTSDVTVTTSGTDAISGIVSCTSNQFQTTESAGAIFNGSCTNGAGLIGNAVPLTVKLDKTGPSAALAVTAGTSGANGWYTSDVTVSTSGSDSISSPVDCTANQFQTTETTGAVFNGSCTNDAGLTTNAAPLTVKLDETGPSAALAVTAGTVGANGWYTSDVTVSTAGSDAISDNVTCTPDQYQTTETTGAVFNGTCTNGAGLSTNAAELTVKLDKTGPSATLAVTAGTLGNNGWYTSDVTVATSGSDTISSPVSCSDDQFLTSDSAGTTFNGSCTNDAGLTTNAAPLTVKLDKTAPTVSLVGGPADGASYYFGFVPAAPTCSASDALSGLDGSCSVSGYGTAVGSHAVTASATDKAGNSASASATYTVLAWTLKGFYQPVDMSGVYNLVKGGSTVPLKFEIFAGPTELTDVANVSSFVQTRIACDGTAPVDDIEFTTSGSTSLRYDWTSGQFIQNWQTPKLPGQCYRVTMTTLDGSFLQAFFKLK